MPTKGYLPPLPPERFPANGYSSTASELLGIAVAVLIIVFFIGAAVLVEVSEKRRSAFIAKCIEFQTYDRCALLYQYRRQDLMEQRR